MTNGVWGTQMQAAMRDNVELCGINAMQSFRLMDVSFGAGNCIGYIPFNLGNPLQIDEAIGGIHIFLQPPAAVSNIESQDWLAQVESDWFRSSILSGCC
jgi:hypothetical protein